MFEFEHLACQSLAKRKDCAATEFGKVYGFTHFLANFIVGIYFMSIAQRNLFVGIIHIVVAHNNTIAINFEVSLVGVYDNVKVFIASEHLGQHTAEALFKNSDESGATDFLIVLKIGKDVNHAFCYVFFAWHFIFCFLLSIR